MHTLIGHALMLKSRLCTAICLGGTVNRTDFALAYKS